VKGIQDRLVPRSIPTITLTACICLATVGCSKVQSSNGRTNAGPSIGVRIFPVQTELVHRRVEAVGSLFALDESTISSQVDGPVDHLWVDVGDTVKQGQPLVSIDPTELQYAVDAQRAAVHQVRAQLGIGPDDPPPSDPSKVAFVQRAAADLLDAKQKNDRAKLLFEAQLIARDQLDETAAKYDSARAANELAIEQVDQLAAQLQSSEVQRRLAEKKLADATIRAPFPGSVKERRVNLGEYLKVQSPIMVIVRTDPLRARLEVPEKWASAVRTGAEADVHVDAFPNEVFHGQLVRINPSVNPDSRAFEVEAMIPNPDNKLKPGFFLQASLASEIEEKTLTIPGDALIYTFGTYKVYVVNGDRLAERTVKPGQQANTSTGVQAEVVEGLHAGERVAVAPAGTVLFEGARVREERR
jgi:RND family efflux transporter MFP subunit